MAASIKISELNSLTNLTDVDLFLVSDMETGTSRKISYNNLKSNIITETSSALTDLEGVVAQNRTDAETLVETVRVALQASIDSNSNTFSIADDGLDARLQVLEADPVTKTYVDTKVSEVIDFAPESLDTLNELAAAMGDNPDLIATIDSRVTALETSTADADALAVETAARIAADDALDTAIASVQAGVTTNATDISALQTTVDNLDIDIAPETLNSINELAGALGDDPQIITNLQAELTAYKAHIEERNLELALAFDVPTYAEIIYGG
jgi:hypothetical protein